MSIASIQARVKRITIEDAYISVPITNELFEDKPGEDGKYHLNMEAFWKKAAELSSNLSVEWKVEEILVEPHNIQKPIPIDRKPFIPNDDA